MDTKQAIKIAKLWRAGKMIGADEPEVLDALVKEIERLRAELDWISDNGPDDAWDLRERAQKALDV